ncbi:MAG TPA: methylated-DNA--[protein]-cysteine S-methyltransferase [Acidimicrobiales bacterium]
MNQNHRDAHEATEATQAAEAAHAAQAAGVDPGTQADVDGPDASLVARLRAGPPSPAAVGDAADLDALVAAAVARADADDLVDVAWSVADTPIGPLTLAATGVGVLRIAFGDEDEVLDELSAAVSPRVLHVPGRLDALRRQLDEYFAGRRRRFDVPLDRRLSRGYRRQVLEALAAGVPYGETVSYKELAVRTENPGAVRAVGTAMATNPLPIVVPCHRVLPASGALGNYGGGPEIKAWLLRLEGAHLML